MSHLERYRTWQKILLQSGDVFHDAKVPIVTLREDRWIDRKVKEDIKNAVDKKSTRGDLQLD